MVWLAFFPQIYLKSKCREMQPINLFKTVCKAQMRKRSNQINSKLISAASFIDIIKEFSIIQSRLKAVQTYIGCLGFLRGYFAR